MFGRIHYRGPFLSGISEYNNAIMAQNYLKADVTGDAGNNKVPFSVSDNPEIKICYDGQIGNWRELLRSSGQADGPFPEERLILFLYRKHGRKMFRYLDDAIFSFVICDGKELFAARDLLGIKTLFYGWKDETLYLATELKSILAVADDVHEFPPGHFMDSSGRLFRYAELPKEPPGLFLKEPGQMVDDIREIIMKSFRNRVDFSVTTAGLLSGGMDSSVINHMASGIYKEKFGPEARLKTFAIGVGESEDIRNARIMAEHIGSEHHELIVELEQVLAALPEVIYYLESFDPSLVRSSVSNFLISGYAKEHGTELLLSGEGGDEVFCGYTYLKEFPREQLFIKQMECLDFLHSNASLRLDRMNHSHSIRVVAPLISGELLTYMMSVPSEYKQKPTEDRKIEKWIFRKAFENSLPESITWRTKQEFSQGSGSAALLPEYFENVIGDAEFKEAQKEHPVLRSKEEFYYYRTFTEHFGYGRAVDTVGQWITL
jgi:asparagine synthase (glutamine-hydrolysing)